MPTADNEDNLPAGDPEAPPDADDSHAAPDSTQLENAQQDTVADSSDQDAPSCHKDKHWIEIKLLDEDGKPIPNEAYVVTGPAGEEHSGILDDDGFVHIDGLDPGTCSVAFPDLTQRYKPDLVAGNIAGD